jgi:hypothetical protein
MLRLEAHIKYDRCIATGCALEVVESGGTYASTGCFAAN